MNHRFHGKTVVVTGAAGNIGTAIVQRFLSEGATVVASDLSEEGLARLAADVAAGERLITRTADVSSLESVEALIDTAVQRTGRLDTLVNNAGLAYVGTVETIDPEAWDRAVRIDLGSVFNGARAALRHLRETGGSIVNTASISGLGGNKGMAVYYAAKGGVVNLTRYLAVEHAHEGVRVNAVCPGPITAGPGSIMEVPELKAAYAANIPAGRTGRADEVAAAIAFLASDDASYVNGHNLVVDGGLTAWTGEPDLATFKAH